MRGNNYVPGNGNLSGRGPLSLGDRLDDLGQLDVPLKRARLEAREPAAVVVGRQIVQGLELARQPAAAHGAVRHERDAQLAARVGHAVLVQHVAREEGKLLLDRGGRVDGVGAADGGRADLAEPVRADLALADQLREGLDGGLDGHLGVDARALEQVDGLGAIEHLQSLIDGGAEPFGAAVGGLAPDVVGALEAEEDARRVLRVLGEVVLEEVQGVGVGGTVEGALGKRWRRVSARSVVFGERNEMRKGAWAKCLAYRVPKVGSVLQGGLQGFDGLLMGKFAGQGKIFGHNKS